MTATPLGVKERLVRAEEEKLGIALPRALRLRLCQSNGGEVELRGEVWRLHPVLDTTNRKRAARSASSIHRESQMARQWRGFPEDGVIMATNGSGDRLVLVPESAIRLSSEIYYFDHEIGKIQPTGHVVEKLG